MVTVAACEITYVNVTVDGLLHTIGNESEFVVTLGYLFISELHFFSLQIIERYVKI